ncbi:hypothetical protein ACVIQT_002079 [Bradyrhizobium diazoefficiens]
MLKDGFDVISRALDYLEKVSLTDVERHAAKYSEGYLALRHLIRDRTNPTRERELLAAAYAVYGWMPTILKRFDLARLSQFMAEVRCFSVNEALPVVREAAKSHRGGTLTALNNSVVGTSKLLHFFRPDLFPIWDFRIAKRFGYANGRHNNATAYLSYFELLHCWCEQYGRLPARLYSVLQRGAPEDDPISQLRLTEYCLFLASAIQYGSDLREPE